MIPCDSLCLAVVASELRGLVGAQAQKVIATGPLGMAVMLYLRGERWLVLSADAEAARIHLARRRPVQADAAPAWLAEFRRRLDGLRLEAVRQRGFDRVVDLDFGGREAVTLTAELMGKHANFMALAEGRTVAAAKWIGPGKSKRPVLPGQPYRPPPFPERPSLLEAKPGDDLKGFEGLSPFLARWMAAQPSRDSALAQIRDAAQGRYRAVLAPGHGAYPLPLAPLGLPEVAADSLSEALEDHFDAWELARDRERLRASLTAGLRRVLLAREVATHELRQAADAGARAGELQRQGELILAYMGAISPGADVLEAWAYEGNPVRIPLRPDLTPQENADRLFRKAKKAKAGAGGAAEQLARLETEAAEIDAALAAAEAAGGLDELRSLHETALRRRWLHQQEHHAHRHERPFEGHAVRETLSPQGWRILYGENAAANEYLTLRLAKPDDWWMHVRTAPGSHVVIVTHRQPERVPPDTIKFAAELAVRHSSAKHARYVPVDYCLRKHVRRPKGAAPGAVVYSREKTIYVDGI